jgi:uncharacterized protein (TIGR02145 family)
MDWRNYAKKIFHHKPLLTIIIFSMFLLGYVFYPEMRKITSINQNSVATNDAVIDIEGNVYRTIKIGDQIWMAENLRTTQFNDGEPIPYVTDDLDWSSLRTSGYCWPNNDVSKKEDYGALYNWYVVETGKLAPEGWHVPSYEEWEILAGYFGGKSVAGDELKEIGFSDSLAGDRIYDGDFVFINELGKYWSSTRGGWHPSDAWYRTISRLESEFGLSSHPRMDGHSVRCIKDN